MSSFFFFFNDTATTEIYTLSLHDALPIFDARELERDVGILRDVEEIARPKVRVTLVAPRLQAVDFNLDLTPGLCVVVVGTLERALELVEQTSDRGHLEVLGGDADMRVLRIDFVLDHWLFLLETRVSYLPDT